MKQVDEIYTPVLGNSLFERRDWNREWKLGPRQKRMGAGAKKGRGHPPAKKPLGSLNEEVEHRVVAAIIVPRSKDTNGNLFANKTATGWCAAGCCCSGGVLLGEIGTPPQQLSYQAIRDDYSEKSMYNRQHCASEFNPNSIPVDERCEA